MDQPAARKTPYEAATGLPELDLRLARVARLSDYRREFIRDVERRIVSEVTDARAAGGTWAEIGRALGFDEVPQGGFIWWRRRASHYTEDDIREMSYHSRKARRNRGDGLKPGQFKAELQELEEIDVLTRELERINEEADKPYLPPDLIG